MIAAERVERASSNVIWIQEKISLFTRMHWILPECTAPRKLQKHDDFKGRCGAQLVAVGWIFPCQRWLCRFWFRLLRHVWLSHLSLSFHCVKFLWIWTDYRLLHSLLSCRQLEHMNFDLHISSFCAIAPLWWNFRTIRSTMKKLSFIKLVELFDNEIVKHVDFNTESLWLPLIYDISINKMCRSIPIR